MSKISKIIGRQVFDSRGNPTIEAEVFSKGTSALAICPSGASTGTYEAYEKRDTKNKKYLGKSVLKAVNLVNTKISKKLKNENIHKQERIDALLINLDGTKQKNNLGANSILAVSMAVKKLSAKLKKLPLYKTFLVKKEAISCKTWLPPSEEDLLTSPGGSGLDCVFTIDDPLYGEGSELCCGHCNQCPNGECMCQCENCGTGGYLGCEGMACVWHEGYSDINTCGSDSDCYHKDFYVPDLKGNL